MRTRTSTSNRILRRDTPFFHLGNARPALMDRVPAHANSAPPQGEPVLSPPGPPAAEQLSDLVSQARSILTAPSTDGSPEARQRQKAQAQAAQASSLYASSLNPPAITSHQRSQDTNEHPTCHRIRQLSQDSCCSNLGTPGSGYSAYEEALAVAPCSDSDSQGQSSGASEAASDNEEDFPASSCNSEDAYTKAMLHAHPRPLVTTKKTSMCRHATLFLTLILTLVLLLILTYTSRPTGASEDASDNEENFPVSSCNSEDAYTKAMLHARAALLLNKYNASIDNAGSKSWSSPSSSTNKPRFAGPLLLPLSTQVALGGRAGPIFYDGPRSLGGSPLIKASPPIWRDHPAPSRHAPGSGSGAPVEAELQGPGALPGQPSPTEEGALGWSDLPLYESTHSVGSVMAWLPDEQEPAEADVGVPAQQSRAAAAPRSTEVEVVGQVPVPASTATSGGGAAPLTQAADPGGEEKRARDAERLILLERAAALLSVSQAKKTGPPSSPGPPGGALQPSVSEIQPYNSLPTRPPQSLQNGLGTTGGLGTALSVPMFGSQLNMGGLATPPTLLGRGSLANSGGLGTSPSITMGGSQLNMMGVQGPPSSTKMGGGQMNMKGAQGPPSSTQMGGSQMNMMGVQGPPSSTQMGGSQMNMKGVQGPPSSTQMGGSQLNMMGVQGPPSSTQMGGSQMNMKGVQGPPSSTKMGGGQMNMKGVQGPPSSTQMGGSQVNMRGLNKSMSTSLRGPGSPSATSFGGLPMVGSQMNMGGLNRVLSNPLGGSSMPSIPMGGSQMNMGGLNTVLSNPLGGGSMPSIPMGGSQMNMGGLNTVPSNPLGGSSMPSIPMGGSQMNMGGLNKSMSASSPMGNSPMLKGGLSPLSLPMGGGILQMGGGSPTSNVQMNMGVMGQASPPQSSNSLGLGAPLQRSPLGVPAQAPPSSMTLLGGPGLDATSALLASGMGASGPRATGQPAPTQMNGGIGSATAASPKLLAAQVESLRRQVQLMRNSSSNSLSTRGPGENIFSRADSNSNSNSVSAAGGSGSLMDTKRADIEHANSSVVAVLLRMSGGNEDTQRLEEITKRAPALQRTNSGTVWTAADI
eukprot:gene16933-23204_t